MTRRNQKFQGTWRSHSSHGLSTYRRLQEKKIVFSKEETWTKNLGDQAYQGIILFASSIV